MTAPTDPEASAPDDVPEQSPVRRRSSGRTILLGAGLVIVLLVGVALWASRDMGEPPVAGSGPNAPKLGEGPPADRDFALPPETLDGFDEGDPVELTGFRGKPLVVNFWASWCVPCVKEMPDFQAVWEELGDKVQFLGVDVADSPINAEPYVEELGITYPLALDPQWEFYRGIGNVAMPTTLLVDPDGIVRYRHTGPLDARELKELLRKHLGTRV